MEGRTHTGDVLVELIRLAVVLTCTAAGYGLGGVGAALGTATEFEETRLITSVLGALTGYIIGGILGRALLRGVDRASAQLRHVPAVQLISAGVGAAVGALLGLALLIPASVLPYRQVTIPLVVAVLFASTYFGGRLGADRGAELGRFVGVRGRLDVRTPSRGGGVKLVDSSALIDGRVAEVARAGFLEGVLVVPRFVIHEVARIADGKEEHRRRLGERGLATLQTLQDEGLVSIEVDEDPVEGVGEVDEKLVALCRARGAGLITGDAALARTAERSGIRVLNPHVLADAVRSPVLPGERVELTLVREGREPGQAVGYLADGSMVVVDDAAHGLGTVIRVDVTSIVQSRTGRLLFASPAAVGEGR